jgi:hypothetical protein
MRPQEILCLFKKHLILSDYLPSQPTIYGTVHSLSLLKQVETSTCQSCFIIQYPSLVKVKVETEWKGKEFQAKVGSKRLEKKKIFLG